MTDSTEITAGSERARIGALDQFGVVLLALCAALAALLELMLVPLYVGSTIAPISVLLAGVGNVALPRLAHNLIPRTLATGAPFFAWLLVVIAFGVINRPEGDVILPASPRAVEYVTYLTLLGGAVVGTATVVLLNPSPAAQARKAAKSVSR